MAGIFLTVEGIEGVGKSTAMDFICDYLKTSHQHFIRTREPGGTLIGEKIRDILLTKNNQPLAPIAELLLMFASRAQLVQEVILPALQKNQWVVSDRFVDASFAYQGGGRGFSVTEIATLEQWVLHDLKPNITILLDAPAEVGFARIQHRGKDRIEQEKLDFFARVRQAYLKRAAEDPDRFRVIDATQSLEKVKIQLKNIVDTLL